MTDPVRTWLQAAFCAVSSLCLMLSLTAAAWITVTAVALDFRPVAIVSGSMAPAIQRGDLLLGSPYDGGDLPVGTVITFSDSEGLGPAGRRTTHRISAQLADGRYETRGDANRQPDSSPVPPANIQHVARVVVPFVGWPAVWLRQQPAALLVAALLWASAIVGPFVLRARRRGGGTPSARHERPGLPAVDVRRRRRSPCGESWSRALVVTGLFAGLVALGLTGTSSAAFVGSTPNPGNSWEAATLDAPGSLTATASGCDVTLEWTASTSPAVNGYEILRGTTQGGPYETSVNQVDAGTTSYTDTPGGTASTYYYVVQAAASTWRSGNSPEASSTTDLLC